ncbi:MAG TPA: hypothetical protein VMH89_09885 [Candidatus Acidoferrum sp.]|nr:hypothetical protein [Candidatus Acidoferrum sp.]
MRRSNLKPLRYLILTYLIAFAFSTSSATHSQDPAAAPFDFFSKVISNLKQSEIFLDDFERTQRVEKRRMASDPTPWNTTATRMFPAGPGMGKIVVSVDGKPTDPPTYRAELEKLEKYLAWAAQDGAAQKDAYLRAEHKRKERFDLMDATQQAFLFTLEGKELRGDRTLLRYSMVPNPGYRPTTRTTVLFTRVRGTLWIDEQSLQLAKIDGSVTEDISIALFLAKVYKGSHFMQERYEVAPGVWEPTFEQYDFDGRKFLASFSIHERTFYSAYKRVGPPKESLQIIRAELSKQPSDQPAR